MKLSTTNYLSYYSSNDTLIKPSPSFKQLADNASIRPTTPLHFGFDPITLAAVATGMTLALIKNHKKSKKLQEESQKPQTATDDSARTQAAESVNEIENKRNEIERLANHFTSSGITEKEKREALKKIYILETEVDSNNLLKTKHIVQALLTSSNMQNPSFPMKSLLADALELMVLNKSLRPPSQVNYQNILIYALEAKDNRLLGLAAYGIMDEPFYAPRLSSTIKSLYAKSVGAQKKIVTNLAHALDKHGFYNKLSPKQASNQVASHYIGLPHLRVELEKVLTAYQRDQYQVDGPASIIYLKSDSGSGKTFLARQLAKAAFGDESLVEVINCSQSPDKVLTGLQNSAAYSYKVILIDEAHRLEDNSFWGNEGSRIREYLKLLLEKKDPNKQKDWKGSIVIIASNSDLADSPRLKTWLSSSDMVDAARNLSHSTVDLTVNFNKAYLSEFLDKFITHQLYKGAVLEGQKLPELLPALEKITSISPEAKEQLLCDIDIDPFTTGRDIVNQVVSSIASAINYSNPSHHRTSLSLGFDKISRKYTLIST